ncbi:hypothetical protein [Frigoriglobus tundricola]|uniref:GYF domain-containing protein n=1 Tax=Frigoriglobus tundricola TaxID=2774151 RepID=A0A6M5YHY1_9BACT|nr:hypothetical protein [Frigoriglobus tundricola]QJW93144.1 hypothetical protein FTUN_0649 [Frigoriglobus tundricola]
MPSVPPATEQFWLLTGAVPTGPFSVDQVHAKIASGDATWQTPACPVGGTNWLPIVRTPGLGPVTGEVKALASEGTESAAPEPLPAQPGSVTASQTTERTSPPPLPFTSSPPVVPAASSEPAPTPAPADPKSERVGAAIGIGIVLLLIAGGVYGVSWVWEQIRSPTATEVCKKLDEAKTAAEAKKYVTPRLHAFVDAEYAKRSPLDPNIEFAFTQEVDGPQPGTKLVGFRGTFFVQDAGQRVQIEGHCKVVKADGWKVDDMIVTGVEGASLPGPVSLVDEHRASLTRPQAPTLGGTTPPGAKTRPPGTGTYVRPTLQQTPAWEKHPIGKVVASIRDEIGWGGIVAIVVLLSVGAAVRESWRKKPPTDS